MQVMFRVMVKGKEWLCDAVNQKRGELAARGQRSSEHFHLSARWMGQPSDSGLWKSLVFCDDEQAARICAENGWNWYVQVPLAIDQRGWRNITVRWYVPLGPGRPLARTRAFDQMAIVKGQRKQHPSSFTIQHNASPIITIHHAPTSITVHISSITTHQS